MPSGRLNKRVLLETRIASLPLVDKAAWKRLKVELHPVSDSYLRSLLKESGKPLSPMVEGIVTTTLQDLERTLLAITAEYSEAGTADQKECRAMVIAAKDRLRWWLRKAAHGDSRQPLKQEALLWVSTWLENPQLFGDWLQLRRKRMLTEAQTTLP